QKTKREARAITDKVSDIIEQRVENNKAQMRKADQDTDAVYNSTWTTITSLSAAAVVLAIFAAFFIAIGINRGLTKAISAVRDVSEGDLTKNAQITTRDEIGQLLEHVNIMIERLRGVVGDSLSAAENVSSGSQELSASSEQVSQGAT
ncbi:HAMP domain-containing protein, partial [Klebsiella pneumoniae]|uniref:HAMP domain-containing protein n=1 Tax=Klebsiella pneumoniae TaxID=573 RepID=UPI00356690F0